MARQPISAMEAVTLLNDQLAHNNYAAVLDGRTLTIMNAGLAKVDGTTPVLTATDPAQVPTDSRIVTEILPVHTLNPAQLLKDLAPLIPANDTVTANEAGNAVIMTARERDIHRVAEIIKALDSTAVSEVHVFELNHADAQSIAAELKELFQSGDSNANRPSGSLIFGPRFGRFNNAGAISGDGQDKTLPTRPVFVADEQMNAVAASASPDYMPMITRVVGLLDRAGQELTDVEVFSLTNADATAVVDEITLLFAPVDGAKSTDLPGRPMGFQFAGAMNPRPTTESTRLKRQSTVTAVADTRTQSVLVLASETLMGEIRKIVTKLDDGERGVMKLSVFHFGEADPVVVQDTLNALYPPLGPEAHAQTSLSDARGARIEAAINGQASSSSSSIGGFSTGGPAQGH
jgi:type II secretory pathway component GspD/PulD (secretin)